MEKLFAISLINPWTNETWVRDIWETLSEKPLKRLKAFVIINTPREVIQQQYSHLLSFPAEKRGFLEPYLDMIAGGKTYFSIYAGHSKTVLDFYSLVSERKEALRRKYNPLIDIEKTHPDINLNVIHASDTYETALRDLEAWQPFIKSKFNLSLVNLLQESRVKLPRELLQE